MNRSMPPATRRSIGAKGFVVNRKRGPEVVTARGFRKPPIVAFRRLRASRAGGGRHVPIRSLNVLAMRAARGSSVPGRRRGSRSHASAESQSGGLWDDVREGLKPIMAWLRLPTFLAPDRLRPDAEHARQLFLRPPSGVARVSNHHPELRRCGHVNSTPAIGSRIGRSRFTKGRLLRADDAGQCLDRVCDSVGG